MTSKISFTVRRPLSSSTSNSHNPSSASSKLRTSSFVPHAVDSSDEEVDENATEFVTAFDESGVQRLHEKPAVSRPLVIAPLVDRDWKAVAWTRKQRFVPDGAAAPTGKDGSQGGLGTRDTINSETQAAGLVKRGRVVSVDGEDVIKADKEVVITTGTSEASEDERARKALLASLESNGDAGAVAIDAIPVESDAFTHPTMSETDAYREDVVTRPDSATLADYERVPVSQFGAAMLRGMGWTEGTTASRTRRGPVEPWLPTSRPALLGLGAKERPAEDTAMVGKRGQTNKRPDKRYVPVVKMEREGPSHSASRSPSRSRPSSRVGSKSSSPYPSDKDRKYQHHLRDETPSDYDRVYEKPGRHRGQWHHDRDVDHELRGQGPESHRIRERPSELNDDGRNIRRQRDRNRQEERGSHEKGHRRL